MARAGIDAGVKAAMFRLIPDGAKRRSGTHAASSPVSAWVSGSSCARPGMTDHPHNPLDPNAPQCKVQT